MARRGKKLLAQEKELTRQYDRVNAARRRLPMVKVEKNYMFDGPGGEESLLDLFQGLRQLVVYHFMFDPSWEKGCHGCTAYVNAIGDLSMLDTCDTSFVMVSRAPLSKLEAYKERQGWPFAWVSSLGSDFNYDFQVTLDKDRPQLDYNYRSEPGALGDADTTELPGMSCFLREGE
jgi:predicted dithiol-disulfide oxidoreductase (DUF899 family)